MAYDPATTKSDIVDTGSTFMAELAIHFSDESIKVRCSLCGDRTAPHRGPQLFRANTTDVVCRHCGKKHAPALAALLDLAQTAQRVGRIGQYTLVPPITALLDLARAAEAYTITAPPACRQAA